MRKSTTLIGIALLTVLTFGQVSAEEPNTRTQVLDLLSGVEYVPSSQEWSELGPEAGNVLREIAADTTQRATIRARAVSSLAHFPSDENRIFVAALVADDAQVVLLRRKAIGTLATLSPTEVQALVPFLAHESIELREATILAMSRIGGETVRTELQARVELESSEHLRTLLTTSIAGLGE